MITRVPPGIGEIPASDTAVMDVLKTLGLAWVAGMLVWMVTRKK